MLLIWHGQPSGVVTPPAVIPSSIIEGAGSGKYKPLEDKDAWEYVEALKSAFAKKEAAKTARAEEKAEEEIEELVAPVRQAMFRYDLPDIEPVVKRADWTRLEKLISRYERLVEEDDEAVMLLL
jgi:hypothetical protein